MEDKKESAVTAATPSKKRYKVDPNALFQFPQMVTVVPVDLVKPDYSKVVTVSLSDTEQTRIFPATKEAPERKQVIKPASQEQLAYLASTGHPFIIEE